MKKDRDIVAIFGRTGTGKTYLAKRLLRKFRRQIIIDPNDEYEDVTQKFYTLEDFLIWTKRLAVFEMLDTVNFRVALTVPDVDVETVARIVFRMPETLFVIDDAAPHLEHPGDNLLVLVRRGRHEAISLLFISYRIPDIHPDIRAQITTGISFQQLGEKEIKNAGNVGFTYDVSQLQSYKENGVAEYTFFGNDLGVLGKPGQVEVAQ
jgi:hypothetical protein